MASIRRERLDRRNESTLCLGEANLAGSDGHSIDVHRARPAMARATAIFGARQIRSVTKRPQQWRQRIHAVLDRPFVDRELRHA